jgi:DNA-binding FadR family transcriptional regulator
MAPVGIVSLLTVVLLRCCMLPSSILAPARAVRVVDLHNRIVEAIRAANGGAWAAMRAHLEKFAAAMRIEPVGS